MIEWPHRLNTGMQAPGGDEGQRNPALYCPWGRKQSDTTGPLNNDHSNSSARGDLTLRECCFLGFVCLFF